jgi:hypothetical protein
MPFRCPQCLTRDGLDIYKSIELPPDRQSDEISLQVVACSVCKWRGLAVYSEGRGTRHGFDSWKHIGYWVSPDAVESVLAAIARCPDPHNRQCECAAHSALGQAELTGEWRGLMEMERGHTFAMRLAS